MWYGESELEDEDYKKIINIVDKYERLSYTVCETCSKPGSNGVTEPDNVWYSTLCTDCRIQEQKRREEADAAYNRNKI